MAYRLAEVRLYWEVDRRQGGNRKRGNTYAGTLDDYYIGNQRILRHERELYRGSSSMTGDSSM